MVVIIIAVLFTLFGFMVVSFFFFLVNPWSKKIERLLGVVGALLTYVNLNLSEAGQMPDWGYWLLTIGYTGLFARLWYGFIRRRFKPIPSKR